MNLTTGCLVGFEALQRRQVTSFETSAERWEKLTCSSTQQGGPRGEVSFDSLLPIVPAMELTDLKITLPRAQRLGIAGSPLQDLALSCCCMSCSQAQQRRELDHELGTTRNQSWDEKEKERA